jgi:hypothetical protein
MKNARRLALVLLAVVVAPAPAHAWGFAAHRLIMARAIALLPSELQPFFTRYRDEVIVRVVDPDLWRSVGWEDDPNHFLDFGVEAYGPYPFDALPREYGAALEKFGSATLKRNGLLPWRAAEEFGNLRRAFDEFKGAAPYATSNVVLFSAVAAHYIQDANQPLHATIDYDGQRTGQGGLHARFERDLIERFESRIRLDVTSPARIANARDAVFDALLRSYQLVPRILQADKDAIAGRRAYDDAYFEAFFQNVHPVLEEQLSRSIADTAGMIVGAWEAAGRPAPRLRDARPEQRPTPPR